MARKVTLTELYGWYVHMPRDPESNWEQAKPCLKCGSAVLNPNTHQAWHQAMLDEATALTILNARVAQQDQGKLF